MASLLRTRNLIRPVLSQVRSLNLQEYQSKGLMDKYGVTIQPFLMASSGEEASKQAKVMLTERNPAENCYR